MSTKALEDRVAELESQAAFQDELHQQLNDVVTRQDERGDGKPLLEPVWIGDQPLPLPSLVEARDYAIAARKALPPDASRARQVEVPVSRALEQLLRDTVNHG